jgi:hypothetical protein
MNTVSISRRTETEACEQTDDLGWIMFSVSISLDQRNHAPNSYKSSPLTHRFYFAIGGLGYGRV